MATIQVKDVIILKCIELVYVGRWCDPLRESTDSFMEKTTKTTFGSVTLKLYKDSLTIVSQMSPHS